MTTLPEMRLRPAAEGACGPGWSPRFAAAALLAAGITVFPLPVVRAEVPTFVDAFHSAHPLSSGGARGLYESMTGLSNFEDRFLDPIEPRAVLWRILNNLLSRYRRTEDLAGMRWVMKLRVAFPDAEAEAEREFARLMGPMN